MANDVSVGLITEQGDLGLGFDPLNKQDAKVYAEAMNKEPEATVINEENK